MRKNNKKISVILSFCLLFTLVLQLFSPIATFASDETIYIESAEDLLEFAKKCSYDAWSVGKKVVLNKDISLEGVDFAPIPSFSGSFNGKNHVISGFVANGSYSPCGLFSSLTVEGEIKNLTVTGSISPDGDKGIVGGIVGDNSGKIDNCTFIGTVMGKYDIGGIAGINRVNGTISNCKVGGEVIGEERTGGIAGSNAGLISTCKNNAKVNTISITPALSLDQINISLTLDITKLPSLNNTTMTDTGGITGYCTGMIIGCTNNGKVGYPHVGYNAGGIAGRSSGHLSSNTNNAEVYGRKDVGGIVGQMEPNISYNLSEDLLNSLQGNLDELNYLVNGAVDKAEGSVPTVSNRLNSILTSLEGATSALDSIINDSIDYGSDFIVEINRISEILSETLSQISNITKDLPEITELLGKGLDSLAQALESFENVATLGSDAIHHLGLAANDATNAFDLISTSIDKIESGINSLRSSIEVDDKEAAKEAINLICDSLCDIVYASDNMVSALGDVVEIFKNASWTNDLISQIAEIGKIFSRMSGAISEIYDATVVIKDNIDVYWSKISESGEDIIKALGYFSSAMENLNTAVKLMDEGLILIIDGIEMLSGSVNIKDMDAVIEAFDQIGEGFNQFIDAAAKVSTVLYELSEAIRQIENEEYSEILTTIADALNNLSSAGEEATEAITNLTEGMAIVLGNVNVDFDSITEGGGLIFNGVGNMTDALKKVSDATGNLLDGMHSLNNAMDAINESVVIKDEEKILKALDSAYNALGEIIHATEDLSVVFNGIIETLEESKKWSDDLISTLSNVTDAMSDISSAIVKIQSGVDSLRSNISFDLDNADEGLGLIIEGLSDMGDATAYVRDVLIHVADAFAAIEDTVDGFADVTNHLAQSMYHFANAAKLITNMSDEINKLLVYLNGIDPIQFPTPGENIKEQAIQLFVCISLIEQELKLLNSDITELSMDLIERIGKINDLFSEMSDNIIDMIYGISDGNSIDKNVSEEEIGSITNGKVFSCINNGNVNGDINVGGISGSMGLEYSLDPEDDLSSELTTTQKRQYKLKAVIHACQNNGSITAKRDAAGGICGKMDLGLIYGCESYGSIQSESGNYVGGIAGITAGLISQSFAKCTLSGGKYVGGIVGSGVSESYSGDSSMVRNCCSMVEIKRFSQYSGAISGANIGEYSENLFISDILAGIDRVSYFGKADPISYQDLIKRRSIPEGFYSFILKFVADGEVIYSVSFSYGDSFDLSNLPEIPKKDGHYGYWDNTNLENLVFDITVNAVYKPYVTTLGSEETRNDGREIFIVEGEFTEDDKTTIVKGADTSGLVLSERLFSKDVLKESWTIVIPKGHSDKNTIHFLPTTNNCRVFVKLDGEWHQVDTEEFGSYILFEADASKLEIAIAAHSLNLLPIILISVLVLSGVAIAVIFIYKNKKAKSIEEKVKDTEEKTEEITA